MQKEPERPPSEEELKQREDTEKEEGQPSEPKTESPSWWESTKSKVGLESEDYYEDLEKQIEAGEEIEDETAKEVTEGVKKKVESEIEETQDEVEDSVEDLTERGADASEMENLEDELEEFIEEATGRIDDIWGQIQSESGKELGGDGTSEEEIPTTDEVIGELEEERRVESGEKEESTEAEASEGPEQTETEQVNINAQLEKMSDLYESRDRLESMIEESSDDEEVKAAKENLDRIDERINDTIDNLRENTNMSNEEILSRFEKVHAGEGDETNEEDGEEVRMEDKSEFWETEEVKEAVAEHQEESEEEEKTEEFEWEGAIPSPEELSPVEGEKEANEAEAKQSETKQEQGEDLVESEVDFEAGVEDQLEETTEMIVGLDNYVEGEMNLDDLDDIEEARNLIGELEQRTENLKEFEDQQQEVEFINAETGNKQSLSPEEAISNLENQLEEAKKGLARKEAEMSLNEISSSIESLNQNLELSDENSINNAIDNINDLIQKAENIKDKVDSDLSELEVNVGEVDSEQPADEAIENFTNSMQETLKDLREIQTKQEQDEISSEDTQKAA